MTTRQDRSEGTVADYRHQAKRKNNPPASLASQGRIREARIRRYYYDPRLPPTLRFDDTGQADAVRALLDATKKRKLSEDEASLLEESIRSPEPWLEWTGKREGQSWFEVEPVALHIHERVSAQAAVRIAARQNVQRGLWADPELDYHEAVQFYKHDVDWSNRLVLGDSLTVMNSLATREDMAGRVQMIYVDPPYGIGFRSNFQPLVRNRNVADRDTDLTREPEVIKAYRDTWTLGVHTYLAYLRDRLTIARDLLADSGSIFVQIGDENVHRVRALMDEVFGDINFVSLIAFKTSVPLGSTHVPGTLNFLLFYAKNRENLKFRRLYTEKLAGEGAYTSLRLVDGGVRSITKKEREGESEIPPNARFFFNLSMLSAGRTESCVYYANVQGRRYFPGGNRSWKTTEEGMARLEKAARLYPTNSTVRYILYHEDYPVSELTDSWVDTGAASDKAYVVQTSSAIIQRCMLMTTDPGDLVLDPTCGSGTTAYVAEQWGRRWITIDTSRVAVALARQRILTAKFEYYRTADGSNKIGGAGFEYKTVPHITMRSIAQSVALDPIFAKWEQVLDKKLEALNDALTEVSDKTRASLLARLDAKPRRGGRSNRVAGADEPRVDPPKERWEHWQVPFGANPEWPVVLRDRLEDYRKAWGGKMNEVDACIAAGAERETLVDRPEVVRGVVRVSGPFTVESVHPPEESLGAESPIGGAPENLDSFGGDSDFIDTDAPSNTDAFHDTLIHLLGKDGVRFQGNKVARFIRLERLSDGSLLHAEGEWENGASDTPHRVAVSFGPQFGPVTAKQVEYSVRAAFIRGYDALVFAGFTFDGAAQAAIQNGRQSGPQDSHGPHSARCQHGWSPERNEEQPVVQCVGPSAHEAYEAGHRRICDRDGGRRHL